MPVKKKIKVNNEPTETIDNSPSLSSTTLAAPCLVSSRRTPSPEIPIEVLSEILPQLPCEILTNILSCIKNDKVSLAKCMRVSTAFNAIARPILYSTIIMEADKMNPYDTTKGGYQYVPHRTSPDMFENVESIKHVIVKYHHYPSEMKGLTMRIFDIDSLRMPKTWLDCPPPCGRCSDELGLAIESCLLIRNYRPKKLIVDGARVECGDHHVADTGRLKTLVFRIASDPSHYSIGWEHISPPRSPLPSSTAGVSRIVQIFSGFRLYGVQERVPSKKYVAQFASGVGWLMKHHPLVKEFVVVNGRQIHYNALDLPSSTSHSEREAKFETMIDDTLCKDASFKVHHHRDLISIEYKTRNVDIRFMSLREYLETHDWSGEFTEEEAEPWLNDDWIEIE